MATLEGQMKNLQEKNKELVLKIQYWKMTAAQRENEKLELMKEINELRLKLSRLRSGGAAQARKLDAELQSASEEALKSLVQASGAVARTMELAKTYMRDRQQLDIASPRWSAITGTPNAERVHRVPPMMGGQSILQPVVSLSRTILNTSNPISAPSPNQSQRNITERAVPMHMLQDVYIPLTRIDAADFPGHNVESDPEVNNMEDSTDDLGLNDSNERSLEASHNITEEEFDESSRRLDAVSEDLEEDEIESPPSRRRSENPLEGPSWLLDRPGSSKSNMIKSRIKLEPDSTTELNRSNLSDNQMSDIEKALSEAPSFSPTVRRRKRASSPRPALASALSPKIPRRPSNSGRVLKVLIAKMSLDDDASPPRRADKPVRFDAPSPNGATDARVIVSEVIRDQNCGDGDARHVRDRSGSFDLTRDSRTLDQDSRTLNHDSRDVSRDSAYRTHDSRDSRDSSPGRDAARSSDEGRTRRPRKAVTYKEKPLNRKMRR